MKAVISNGGMVALVFSDFQRFLVTASPLEEGGFSVGIDNLRILTVKTEAEARMTILETVEFFTKSILEVK